MKVLLAVALLAGALASTSTAQVVFVDADATGADTGTSWTDAYTDLQSGLDVAVQGTQIWIAEGTYTPSVLVGGGDHRYATFVLPDGVALLGGFAGTETNAAEASPQARPTVLSGDLGVSGDTEDNSYHVVTLTGTGPGTSMDGLTITGGNAVGPGNDDKRGGGLRLEASTLHLSRCTVRENAGQIGAGLWSAGDGDELVVTECTFEDNTLDLGLLAFNTSGTSVSSVMLADSHITGNADGGMSLGSLMTGTIERCLFEGNGGPSADLGGLRVSSGAEIQLADSTFKDNAAWVQGGGVDLYVNQDDGRLRRISRCTFEGNSAGHGGGLAVQGGFDFEPDGCGAPEVLIDECVFLGNTANIGHGGGMVIHWACPQIVNSTFLGNSADKGGAIAIPNTTNENFESEESSPFIVNTLIAGNTADQGGGIFLLGAHKPYLLNCTLAHNTATVDGGGLWVSSQNIVGFAAPRIVNSLLWGNVDAGGADESAQFHNAGQAAAIINYTLLQGSSGGGVATHGADPLFTDPDGADDVYGTRDDDLTVQAGSPAIDSGNNEPYLVPWAVTDVADLDCDGDFAEPVALDRARVRRFVDDPAVADTGFGAAPMIDRGAYERGAWRHLGSELAGTHGKPCLVGDGNLVSGSTTGLALSNTLEFATSGLFLGLSAANFAPFFGGTLVPSPDILILIPTGATGGWTAAGAFPAGVPAGFTFWAHVWVEDPAAAFGLAGSNAVSATSP